MMSIWIRRCVPGQGGNLPSFSLGFVERLNNKIRVIQRRAYGLRDEN